MSKAGLRAWRKEMIESLRHQAARRRWLAKIVQVGALMNPLVWATLRSLQARRRGR